MGKEKRLTTEQWLQKIPEEKRLGYDYSKVLYVNKETKVLIICKTCDHEFLQRPDSHATRSGCPACAKRKSDEAQRVGTETFIAKTKEKVSEDYDYSLVDYKNTYTYITLICKVSEHGAFRVIPRNLLQGGRCPKCSQIRINKKITKTQEEYIAQCEAQGDAKTTFEKVKYVNADTKVTFNCTEHGPYDKTASKYLEGSRCPACALWGYRKSRPGRFYILSDGNTTKVGITYKNPAVRAKAILKSGGPDMQVIADLFFKDGSIPMTIESSCIAYLRTLYEQQTENFDGRTECFYKVDIEDLTRFITSLAIPTESDESDQSF